MTEPRYATFGARALAWIVDAVPHAFLPYLAGRATGSTALAVAAFLIVGIVWSIVPEGRSGVTVGKLLAGVRVERGDGEGHLGLARAALRWLVKYVVGGALPVSYLWYLRDRRRRTWHDLAAGSIVTDVAGGPSAESA